MGRERNGTRKYLHLCAVGLIIALLGACAPVKMILAEKENRAHLRSAQDLLRQGDFEGALRENKKVLTLSPKKPPGDAALFSMGLIHVQEANPKKDYEQALSCFAKIEEDFPGSHLAEEARVWAGVLETLTTTPEQESRAHLGKIQSLMRQGDFEGALRENKKVLAEHPKKSPGDVALFSMGLSHIHYANPKKDYKRALGIFSQFQKDFPRSPLTEEAKVWAGVLEAMEKTMLIDLEIEEKKKELTR